MRRGWSVRAEFIVDGGFEITVSLVAPLLGLSESELDWGAGI